MWYYCVCYSTLPPGTGWTCRIVGVLPYTIVSKYSLYKTLLMMDRWGPKDVELKPKCWLKLIHWDHIVYLVGLYIYIYYKMIHGSYNVKFELYTLLIRFKYRRILCVILLTLWAIIPFLYVSLSKVAVACLLSCDIFNKTRLIFNEFYLPLYPCVPTITIALPACHFLPLYAWNKCRTSKHSFIIYILVSLFKFSDVFQFCLKPNNNDGHHPNHNTHFC